MEIFRDVLFGMRIAAVGHVLAETLATDTQVMARALRAELEGRARELR
jgi:hypothetical protein